jgi:hypothetical protein
MFNFDKKKPVSPPDLTALETAKLKELTEAVKPQAEIFNRIINKAIAQGFTFPDWPQNPADQLATCINMLLLGAAPVIIFDHNFCAAYWGKDIIEWRGQKDWPAWECRIQAMALEFDRIGYMAKFL